MTPQDKIKWVKINQGDKLKAIEAEINQVMSLKINFTTKGDLLIKAFDKMTELFAPVSPCKAGCSHCCYQALPIFQWEAERIAVYMKRKPADCKMYDFDTWEVEDKKQLATQYSGVVCPFLADGNCSIYPARPVNCRFHISLADDWTPCDIINNPDASVPYLNWGHFQGLWITFMLSKKQKIADIRKFFP